MNKLFAERTASYFIFITLSLIVLFHLLVLTGIVPYQIVWGGRLTNQSQMIQFESFSIGINLVMIAIVAIRAGWWRVQMHPLVITILLWLMSGLFLLNTVGNLLSINTFEKWVFTPLTLLLSVCSLRLALNKHKKA